MKRVNLIAVVCLGVIMIVIMESLHRLAGASVDCAGVGASHTLRAAQAQARGTNKISNNGNGSSRSSTNDAHRHSEPSSSSSSSSTSSSSALAKLTAKDDDTLFKQRRATRRVSKTKDMRAIEVLFAAGVDCRKRGASPQSADNQLLPNIATSWSTAGKVGDGHYFYRSNKRKVFFTDALLEQWQSEAFYPDVDNALRFPVTRNQLGIVVFTGGNFVNNRAKSIYDVWLKDFDNGKMYTRAKSDNPPITIIPELRSEVRHVVPRVFFYQKDSQSEFTS
jgi:hypothetical protein